jgi:hypothetical protein
MDRGWEGHSISFLVLVLGCEAPEACGAENAGLQFKFSLSLAGSGICAVHISASTWNAEDNRHRTRFMMIAWRCSAIPSRES